MNEVRPSTKDAIREAAFQLFNEKPNASLSDVAERAGVGRATLHRHFQSRDVLMTALAHAARDELNAAVDEAVADAQSYAEGLKLALGAIIPLANRQWFLANQEFGDDAELLAAYDADQKELLNDLEQAKAESVFRKDVPTRWIAETYENLIYAAWSLVRDGDATPKQAADLAWLTLTSGLSGEQNGH